MKKNAGDLKMSLKQARKLCVLERISGTLQHWLVVDMRLAGITSIEATNAFLATYPDKHNARFAAEPAKKTQKNKKEKTPVIPAPDHPWRRWFGDKSNPREQIHPVTTATKEG
jgi:hypothetical protein